MTIKQISVFVENKPGRLSEITQALADNQVEIFALSIADTTEFGILRLIVNDPDGAVKAMQEAGYTASVTQVIAICNTNSIQGLAKAMHALRDAGINVEYMYAFIGSKDNRSIVILRVDNNEKAIQALQSAEIEILSAASLC